MFTVLVQCRRSRDSHAALDVRHQPFDDGSERKPAGESPVMIRNQLKSPLGKGAGRRSDLSQSRHVFRARPWLVVTLRLRTLASNKAHQAKSIGWAYCQSGIFW